MKSLSWRINMSEECELADKCIPFKFRCHCMDIYSYESLENVAKIIELRGCGKFITGAVGLQRQNNLAIHTRKAPETNRTEAGRTDGLASCSDSRSSSCRPLRVQHTATWFSMATATRRQNIASFLFSLFTIHKDICLVHQLPHYTDTHLILPYCMSCCIKKPLN